MSWRQLHCTWWSSSQNPANGGLSTFILVKPQITSYELSTMSYWYRTRYELHKNAPAPSDDSTVRCLDRNIIVRRRSAPDVDGIQLFWLNIRSYHRQPVYARFIISLYRARYLQDVVNSTGKFNSIVKMLKPVLCYSRESDLLNLREKMCDTVANQCASFELNLDRGNSRWTIL